MEHQPFAILGAGSWGTALALHLARNRQKVHLWSITPERVATMIAEKQNSRYLPGILFPESLTVSADLAATLKDVNDILIAVPSSAFRETLMRIKPLIKKDSRIAWATKGIDRFSGQLLHETAKEILGSERPFAVLSGPSFAREVAAGLPTAVVVASQHNSFAQDLMLRFNNQFFRVYISKDMVGVELGGIVKNVIAIATGISDGMGFGANARSALMTRGLAEMMRLAATLGGQQETLMGLAGLGDLVLSCIDDQSRNRRFGILLGKGKTPAEAEREINQVVEGKQNTEFVIRLAQKSKIDMPISTVVLEILQGKLAPRDAMKSLLSREPRAESS